MKISIAIPTWESHGKGEEFLDDLFRTIEIQTFKEFEVVISDHSFDDSLLNTILNYESKFKIVYVKNDQNRGNSSSNLNSAIKNCSGQIIKIMFQDDFFYDDESLDKIYAEFTDDTTWLVCGSNHTKDHGNSFYWDLYPKWNDNLLNGLNSIGSPSSLSVRREVFEKIEFDTNLVMMMDCEFYYNVKKIYGEPIYFNDILISNRVHSDQISYQFYKKNDSNRKLFSELKYCKNKHCLN